jgi:hypothetical protein
MKPRSKRKVILAALPAGFIDNLPPEDQRALLEAVGKPAMLNGYDEDGRAELEFCRRRGRFSHDLGRSGVCGYALVKLGRN